MPALFAFLVGLLLVAAYWPGWSQPAMEPKTLVLLVAGGLGALAGLRRPRMPRLPWTLLLPLAGLLASAAWSPAPFLGIPRVLGLLAAVCLVALLQEEEVLEAFMRGVLLGTGFHAALIVLQFLPGVRDLLLPWGLGYDPFQGVGRGLFHNTNMAAQPLLWSIVWVVLQPGSARERQRVHLAWLLPALVLTHSRLAVGVGSAVLAYAAACDLRREGFRPWPVLWLLSAIGLGAGAHRFGLLLPLAASLAALRPSLDRAPSIAGRRPWPLAGAALALLLSLPFSPAANPKNLPAAGPAAGRQDQSLAQRKHYARACAMAFAEQPLRGHGLGAFRPLYPCHVDAAAGAWETAYGDFSRPNNPHSEPLECLLEGGLLLLACFGVGLWLDRKAGHAWPRLWLLWPLGLLAMMDFPLHYPIGQVWLILGLATPVAGPGRPSRVRAFGILGQALAGLGLLAAGLSLFGVARRRPAVEARFAARRDPAGVLREARLLWHRYPGSADLFDLYSKSAIQAAAFGREGDDLDALLRWDPYDHHLLLARAQMATRAGDRRLASALLSRYQAVAPRDPARYLRLAEDALRAGRPAGVRQLVEEARRQPGFGPGHQAQAARLEALAEASSQGPGRP